MSKPLSWYQSDVPPASHLVASASLSVNGAVNWALTSGGAMSTVVASVLSRNAFGWSGPGLAHVFVTYIARLVYSCAILQPSLGSTATSPPSPPKLETIFGAPGRSSEPPL